MRHRKIAAIVVVLIATLGFSHLAQSQERARSQSRGMRERGSAAWQQRTGPEAPWITIILRNRDRLQLTSEQVASLEKLRSDFAREAIRKQADLRIAELDLRRLLAGEPVDLAQVKTKLEEAARLNTDLRYARIETLEKGKAVLTAEQRDKLRNLTSVPRSSVPEPRGKAS